MKTNSRLSNEETERYNKMTPEQREAEEEELAQKTRDLIKAMRKAGVKI